MRRGACLAFGLAVMMVAFVSLHAAPAFAAKRVALVIGNNTYENVPALKKAVNDAGAISQELAKLGFDVVSAENVGRRAMSRALVELESKIESGDTALIYFAGHGFAVDGTNYLLPVDVPEAGPGEEGLVRDASFAATGLSDRLQEKGAATVILILDACRDNPFALQGQAQHGTDARAFAHGPSRRHVRAVLGGARPVGARPVERDRREPELRIHPHAVEGNGAARPIHGADRQAHAKQSQGACRQGRSCAGAGLLRSDRRRSLSRAGGRNARQGQRRYAARGRRDERAAAAGAESRGAAGKPAADRELHPLKLGLDGERLAAGGSDPVRLSRRRQGRFHRRGACSTCSTSAPARACRRPISRWRRTRARPRSTSPGATSAASRQTWSPSISIRPLRSPRSRRSSSSSSGRAGSRFANGRG